MAVGNGDLRTTCAHSLSVHPPTGPLKTNSLSASRRTLRPALGFHSAVFGSGENAAFKASFNGTAITLQLHRLLTTEGLQQQMKKLPHVTLLIHTASPTPPAYRRCLCND